MTIEQVNEVLKPYDINITTDAELQLLTKLISLPTSDQFCLLNDLEVDEVFDTKQKEFLF